MMMIRAVFSGQGFLMLDFLTDEKKHDIVSL